MSSRPVVVLVSAAGADWETAALTALDHDRGVVVLKRCVDVDDLLATAASGQADAAVVGLEAHGLDASAVDVLRRHGVRPVAVLAAGSNPEEGRLRATRIGVGVLVPEADVSSVGEAVRSTDEPTATQVPAPTDDALETFEDPGLASQPRTPGRVVTVWGPAGAPGRTTLAATLAATCAARGAASQLVDADPWGGSVAQQLGVLDEVSGLLAAARLAAGGLLEQRLSSVQRGLGPHLSVVTGLPRADRWAEVRPDALTQLLDASRSRGHVVVDTGFSLEDDPGSDLSGRPGRNSLTLTALSAADEVLAVGTADPVGLSRLARGLVDLGELVDAPVHVVVNRMRPSLGWSEAEVRDMIRGFARVEAVHFLPDDRAAIDRALVTGRSVVEQGDSAYGRAVAALADILVPGPEAVRRPPVRRRRAGRARRS